MKLTSRKTVLAPAPATQRLKARAGFGVIEAMVALIVLAMAMMGLAGMLMQAARVATTMSARTGRAATQTKTLNRLAALPYDSLATKVGCVTIAVQPFPHTSCITVTDVAGGSGSKLVRLIITPTDTRLRADTSYLTRSVGAPTNPLNR